MNVVYTPAEAAAIIKCSDDHVRTLINDGVLPAKNIGRGKSRPRWRISRETIEEFLSQRSNPAATERRKQHAPKTIRKWV